MRADGRPALWQPLMALACSGVLIADTAGLNIGKAARLVAASLLLLLAVLSLIGVARSLNRGGAHG